jgi:hypothetical protein
LYSGNGKHKVINSIRKQAKCAVGIIDEDPGSSNYSKKDLNVKIKCKQYHFTVYVYKNDNCKIIIELEKKLEDWIINCAKKDLLSRYNIPTDPDKYPSNPTNNSEEQFMKEFVMCECAKGLKNAIE